MSDLHKTLSKSSLYAPLAAYEQDSVLPSQYLTNKKRVPESVKESSMVELLVQVSQDINQHRSITIGKNNGSKALSQSEVDARIRQRGLTLVGGGINNDRIRREKRAKDSINISNRTRKRVLKASQKQSSFPFHLSHVNSIAALHEMWNDYFNELLPKGVVNPSITTPLSLHLAPMMDQVELVGAYATITSCKGHNQMVGKEGYVVGMTANTWKMIQLAKTKREHDKFLIVPKEGSILLLRVTLTRTKEARGITEAEKPKIVHIAIHGK